MTWMTGNIGSILAVGLLGCTRTCQMTPASRTVRLNWTYRTTGSDRGQTGTPRPTSTRLTRAPRAARVTGSGNLRKEFRGTKVREANMAGVVIAVTIALFLGGVVVGIIAVVALAVRREDRAYTLVGDAPNRMSRSARRLNGLGRRDLNPELFRSARELVH